MKGNTHHHHLREGDITFLKDVDLLTTGVSVMEDCPHNRLPFIIDGTQVKRGCRFMAIDQWSSRNNGIWTTSLTSDNIRRSEDFPKDSSSRGIAVYVVGGLVNHDSYWVCSVWGIVGYNALEFERVTNRRDRDMLASMRLRLRLDKLDESRSAAADWDARKDRDNNALHVPITQPNPLPDPMSIGERLKDVKDEVCGDEDDAVACAICFERKKKCLVMPCRHLCMCAKCSIRALGEDVKACPMCRGDINDIIVVFS